MFFDMTVGLKAHDSRSHAPSYLEKLAAPDLSCWSLESLTVEWVARPLAIRPPAPVPVHQAESFSPAKFNY